MENKENLYYYLLHNFVYSLVLIVFLLSYPRIQFFFSGAYKKKSVFFF